MEKNFELVDLYWHDSLMVTFDEELQTYNILDARFDDLKSRSGFYCIYGLHKSYGQDVLLYIGETKETDTTNRSFETRLREHLSTRFWYHTNLSVSLGICEVALEHKAVKLIESILIAAHKPALNRNCIDCALEGSQSYLVRNWGFLRSLQNESSGDYWRQGKK